MAPSNLEHNHLRKRGIIRHLFQGYFPRPRLSECSQMCFPIILQFSLEWWCMKAAACLLLSGQNATHFWGAVCWSHAAKIGAVIDLSLGDITRQCFRICYTPEFPLMTSPGILTGGDVHKCQDMAQTENSDPRLFFFFVVSFFFFKWPLPCQNEVFDNIWEKGKRLWKPVNHIQRLNISSSSPGTFLSWRMVLCIPSWQKSEGLKIARNHSESSAFHMHA